MSDQQFDPTAKPIWEEVDEVLAGVDPAELAKLPTSQDADARAAAWREWAERRRGNYPLNIGNILRSGGYDAAADELEALLNGDDA